MRKIYTLAIFDNHLLTIVKVSIYIHNLPKHRIIESSYLPIYSPKHRFNALVILISQTNPTVINGHFSIKYILF